MCPSGPGYDACIAMCNRIFQPEGTNHTTWVVGSKRRAKLWAIEQQRIQVEMEKGLPHDWG